MYYIHCDPKYNTNILRGNRTSKVKDTLVNKPVPGNWKQGSCYSLKGKGENHFEYQHEIFKSFNEPLPQLIVTGDFFPCITKFSGKVH